MPPAPVRGLLLAWVVAGCAVPQPDAPAGIATQPTGPDHTLYFVRRGWHTDVAVPAAELPATLAPLRSDFPGATYYVFGFGERAWLLTRDRGPLEMIEALLPGPSAMLVTGLRADPAAAFGADHVTAVRVSDAGFRRAAGFLAGSFAAPERIAEGPYPGSLFYAGIHSYSLTYTCNTWTAQMLQLAGLPVHTFPVLFAGQVTSQLSP